MRPFFANLFILKHNNVLMLPAGFPVKFMLENYPRNATETPFFKFVLANFAKRHKALCWFRQKERRLNHQRNENTSGK